MALSSKLLHEVLKKYSDDVNANQRQELTFMFQFADVINEMQISISERLIKGVAQERLQKNIDMIDTLLSIFKNIDSFYFASHLKGQKIVQLEAINYRMGIDILELRAEVKKLTETIGWENLT